jgi:hypothetical protein
MKKNQELFYFFTIADVADFKSKLASDILPLITTTTQLLSVSTQPITALNIAFSSSGLNVLNVTDSLGDSAFAGGQFADLSNLGDPGSTNWVPEFAGTGIHGVFLFASDTVDNIDAAVSSLESDLGDSITKVYYLQAAARPGSEAGHERQYLPGRTQIYAASKPFFAQTLDSSTGSRTLPSMASLQARCQASSSPMPAQLC